MFFEAGDQRAGNLRIDPDESIRLVAMEHAAEFIDPGNFLAFALPETEPDLLQRIDTQTLVDGAPQFLDPFSCPR